MKVLAVVASAKKDGNVSRICQKIIEGAGLAGHQTEIINLHDYDLKYCTGCLACTRTHQCVIEDEFSLLYTKEKEADFIIYGTPIYCHDVPGILKNFMDRHSHAKIPYMETGNSLSSFEKAKMSLDYVKRFNQSEPLKNKRFGIVIACSDPNKHSKQIKQVLFVLKNFIQNEMKARISGKIICSGTLFPLEGKGLERIMESARQMGNRVV